MVMGFVVLFAIDAAIALVVLGFFFWGLTDGSVSSFNILLWLTLISAVGGILVGSWILRANGRPRIAKWLARSVGLARMSDRFLLSGANSRARALELVPITTE